MKNTQILSSPKKLAKSVLFVGIFAFSCLIASDFNREVQRIFSK